MNLWQAEGEFLTPDNSAAAFNTPEGKKALDFWLDLINSGISPYAKWGEFEKGQGGSAQEGSWMVGIWAPDPPFDFGVAKAPHPEDGVPATNLGGEQAMVFDNDEAKVHRRGRSSWRGSSRRSRSPAGARRRGCCRSPTRSPPVPTTSPG